MLSPEKQKRLDALIAKENLHKQSLPQPLVSTPIQDPSLLETVQSNSSGVAEGLEDFGLGAAQGATFGFADEGEALLKNAFDQGLVNPLSKEWLEAYKLKKIEAEKKYEEAQERSPWLYGGGNIAGGVLVPGIGGAGILASGERMAIKSALKSGLGAGTKAVAKAVAKDAAIGGVGGALYSAGDSKGSLLSEEGRSKLIDDVKMGGVMGGTIGGTVGLTSALAPVAVDFGKKAGKKVLDFAESRMGGNKATKLNKMAYEMGKDGIGLTDPTRSAFISKTQDDFIPSYTKKLLDADGELNKNYGKVIENSKHTINATDEYLSFGSEVSPFLEQNILPLSVKKEIDGVLGNFKVGNAPSLENIPAKEAKRIIDKLDSLVQKYSLNDNVDLQEIGSYLNKYKKSLKEKLLQDPEINKVNIDIKDYRSNVLEPILNAAEQTKSRFKDISFQDRQGKIATKLSKMVEGAGKAGTSGDDALLSLNRYKAGLKDLETKNPNAYSFLKNSPEELTSALQKQAEQSAVLNVVGKTSPQSGWESNLMRMVGGADTGAGIMARGFNLTGKAQKGLSSASNSTLGKIAWGLTSVPKRAMYDLPIEAAGELANHLSSSSNVMFKHSGDALMRAVNNRDQIAKNAAMFSIMQNPNIKKFLNIEDDKK